MTDIDLIPADYRRWRLHKAILIRYGISLVLINSVFAIAGLFLSSAVTTSKATVMRLKTENAVTQQQQTELQQLDNQQSEYERRWSLLRGLRAGAAVDDIFVLIDQSVAAGDLWFLNWSFRRAGVVVDGQQQGVETGYFIIIKEGNDPLGDKALAVETHMTIRGQAKDHQALSTFVRTLFAQHDVKDVNVQRTSRTDYANGQVVEFDLRIILNSVLRDT